MNSVAERIAVVSFDALFGISLNESLVKQLRRGPLISQSHKSLGKTAAQLRGIALCMVPGNDLADLDKTIQLAVNESVETFNETRLDLLHDVAERHSMLAMSSAPAFIVRRAIGELSGSFGMEFDGQLATHVGIDDENRFTGVFKPLDKRTEIKALIADIGAERLDLLAAANESDRKLSHMFQSMIDIAH